MFARDDRRRRRGLELGLVEVPATRDAVDVLMLVLTLSARRCKGLAFALRELRLSLHFEGKLQDWRRSWRQERRAAPRKRADRVEGSGLTDAGVARTRWYEAMRRNLRALPLLEPPVTLEEIRTTARGASSR